MNVQLTLACGRYDRTQPLIDGRVKPEGVDLTFLPLRPGETFWRMLNHGEFDASESRVFRHSALYVRADSDREARRSKRQTRGCRRLSDDGGGLGPRVPDPGIRCQARGHRVGRR